MTSNDQLAYRICYKFSSVKPHIKTKEREWIVYADSYGDAERKFDIMFELVNDITDDLYGDDAIYEIISISKVEESK